MNNTHAITNEPTAIDWVALGLNVEIVFDGANDLCPCCSTADSLPLAA